MQQEREIDDEDYKSEEGKTKGEFKVRPRYLPSSKMYNLSSRRHRISETMNDDVREQEKEMDNENDKSDKDKTKGEFKVRARYVAT